MAPQQPSDAQTFQGSSIEDVLAKVRSDLGADAEIVEANKVRSGGIGGFFAKETFEVVARKAAPGAAPTGLPAGIDEAAFDKAAAHVAASRAPAGSLSASIVGDNLMNLVDKVSSDEAAQPLSVSPDHHPPLAARHTPPAVSPDQHPPLAARHGMAEAAGGSQTTSPVPHTPFEPFTAEAMPHLSTEGGAFNEVLQRIASDADPEIAQAIDRRLGPSLTPEPAPRPLTPVGPQARSRAAHAAEMMQPAAAPMPAPAPAAQPAPEPIAEATLTPAPPTMEPISDLVRPAEHSISDRTERLMSWLQRDNLPKTTLLTALRGLPRVPELPDTTGVVVAVVGARADALRLCKKMAKAVGGGADDVVLASRDYKGSAIPKERRIIDVTDASRDRLSWRRRELPTFVAVEAPSTVKPEALAWTREIVDQLEVHHVVGVVSAARKTSDVASWAERIGGVDAFAIRDLDETDTPYALLELEVPVAYLGDVPATPGQWAHVLLEGSDR